VGDSTRLQRRSIDHSERIGLPNIEPGLEIIFAPPYPKRCAPPDRTSTSIRCVRLDSCSHEPIASETSHTHTSARVRVPFRGSSLRFSAGHTQASRVPSAQPTEVHTGVVVSRDPGISSIHQRPFPSFHVPARIELKASFAIASQLWHH